MNVLGGCVIFIILCVIICLLVLVALADPRYYDDSEGDEDDA